MAEPIDILILSNGPGELATWVKPTVVALRQRLGYDPAQVRISVILSPCVNASGREVETAQSFPEVDRVQAAKDFFPFLLWGKTAAAWDWHHRGVVLFLGGDQFFPIVIGRRLGYRTVVYAEWEARWQPWIDRFAVMQPSIRDRAKPHLRHKLIVVGDLMAEAGQATAASSLGQAPLIGLLPGSKPMKLSLGVPLTLAIAEYLHQHRPEIQFGIPVAPTITPKILATYADPLQNPAIEQLGWGRASLIESELGQPYLCTPTGLRIQLWTAFPAYDRWLECQLCLTSIGANTAELGALAVPMMTLAPTQQLDLMRAWDGLPGILANLPGIGSSFAKVINWIALQRIGLLAWPNIWAGEEIVPELVGQLTPASVGDLVLDYLDHPEKLDQMRERLRQVRGTPGAATKIAEIVAAELAQS